MKLYQLNIGIVKDWCGKGGEDTMLALELDRRKFAELANGNNMTDLQLAKALEISPVQLWRVRLPENHPRHSYPGIAFLCGALLLFGVKFEELFSIKRISENNG